MNILRVFVAVASISEGLAMLKYGDTGFVLVVVITVLAFFASGVLKHLSAALLGRPGVIAGRAQKAVGGLVYSGAYWLFAQVMSGTGVGVFVMCLAVLFSLLLQECFQPAPCVQG